VKLLALDTSTDACSAALWLDGAVAERFMLTPRGHADHILAMCESLLAEAGLKLKDLDTLAFGRGPGAFTGVRIATGVVQGLAFGAGLPVVPVSSLAALAHAAPADRVLAAMDARMGEVYWGAYRRDAGGIVRLVGEERVCPHQQVPMPEGTGWTGVGSGWDRYSAALLSRLGEAAAGWKPDCYPHAADTAVLGADGYRLGLAVAPELALPVYLRDEVVHKR
jgi:tRNA threonylcarbamoyladenosine biosynthesis protein TsaB